MGVSASKGRLATFGVLCGAVIAAVLALTPCVLAQAPPPVWESYSIEQGLSQSIVKAIAQDARGFLWFGTEDGLNRFDGYRFDIMRHDPQDSGSLSYSDMTALCVDRQGYVWVGTFNGGLNRFDPATGRAVRYQAKPGMPGSLSHDRIAAVVEDRRGDVWVGTDDGLNRLDRATNTFTVLRHDPADAGSLANDRVHALLVDREGTLWIGTDGGLDRLVPATTPRSPDHRLPRFEHYRHDPRATGSRGADAVNALCQDRQGALWVGTEGGGLNRLDSRSGVWTRFRHDPADAGSLGQDAVTAVCADSLGFLWAGTRSGGLDRFDPRAGRFSHYRADPADPASPRSDEILSLLADRSGCLWVGTYSQGVGKTVLETKPFAHVRAGPGGLANPTVWALQEDRSGNLWVGTHTGGIDCFDPHLRLLARYRNDPRDPTSLSCDIVRCILEDRDSELWFGTNGGGLDRLDRATGRFTRYLNDPADPRSLAENRIRALYEDRAGLLWIGTYGGGLDCLDRRTGVFTHFRHDPANPASLSFDIVRVIYEDPDEVGEALWVGTEGGGLNRLDRRTGRFTHFRNDPGDSTTLSEDHVFSIHRDASDRLWIGTFAGGLNLFDRAAGTFASYTIRDGLPSNAVYGILEDRGGCLWLSTNLGLARFDPSAGTCRSYDVRDGLQSNEFNGGAFTQTRGGEMLFGGINGFNAFYPQQIVDNPHPPAVVLTGFQLFNQTVGVGRKYGDRVLLERAIFATEAITLAHDQNFFAFDFAALHFVSPTENRYAYMMEGFDKDWNQAGQRRFATYTGLPPGHYTFRVKAANSDGVWNSEGRTLRLTIAPPFWQTAWFRAAALGLLIGLLVAVHRLRTRSFRLRNAALCREVDDRKRAEEAMRGAMEAARQANQVKSEFLANISHEFRTPMNGIIGMTDLTLDSELTAEQREQLEFVRESADSLLEIMNNILAFSRIEAGCLDFVERDFDLPALLSETTGPLETQARAKGLDWRLELDPGLPASLKGDRDGLQQVLQQVVGNAVKFTTRGEIAIRIGARPDAQPPAGETGDAAIPRLCLEFAVGDTGIGIPAAHLPSIFDSFRQVDGSYTRDHGGTGIGLSLCQKLLRMMRGDIAVTSEFGRGTSVRFHVWFELGQPLERPVFAPDAVVTPVVSAGGNDPRDEASARRILLAEDIPLNQKVASGILRRAGYAVTVVGNGQEALTALERETFDLVLMDIQMPVMDGFEATARIRSSRTAIRHLPIIALTAHTLEGDRDRCLQAGMDDYVTKPVRSETLTTSIAKALEARCAF